jgi:hypothetical protein
MSHSSLPSTRSATAQDDPPPATGRAGLAATITVLSVALAAAVLAGIAVGPVTIPLPDVLRYVGAALTGGSIRADELPAYAIVWHVRVPRVPLADAGRLRRQLFLLTTLVTGVLVAVSGAVGFVGLIMPHLVRILVGSEHRRVLLVTPAGPRLLDRLPVLLRPCAARARPDRPGDDGLRHRTGPPRLHANLPPREFSRRWAPAGPG